MKIRYVVLMVLLMLIVGVVGHSETHYNREGVVVEVNGDIITVEDFTGNLWDFIGDSYSVNDMVNMTMFNNGTSSIYDDSIIEVVVIER